MASVKAAALALLAALACLVCISAQGGRPTFQSELPLGLWGGSAVHVSFGFGRLLLPFWVPLHGHVYRICSLGCCWAGSTLLRRCA